MKKREDIIMFLDEHKSPTPSKIMEKKVLRDKWRKIKSKIPYIKFADKDSKEFGYKYLVISKYGAMGFGQLKYAINNWWFNIKLLFEK